MALIVKSIVASEADLWFSESPRAMLTALDVFPLDIFTALLGLILHCLPLVFVPMLLPCSGTFLLW